MQEYLEIGQIVNTTGLKGFVRVMPFTDDITRFEKLKSLYLVKGQELLEKEVQEVRYYKNMVVLKLKGIDTVEEAQKLKGLYLKIQRKDAVKLPKNSYFIVDILGLDVYSTKGEHLGKVEDIFPTGSNDVYVVRSSEGKQILIPAIKSVIKNIDLENKKIEVDLIQGLVEWSLMF